MKEVKKQLLIHLFDKVGMVAKETKQDDLKSFSIYYLNAWPENNN